MAGRRRPAGEARLSDRQQRFVEEYLVDLNILAAARRAGYSPKTGHATDRLMVPAVQAAIDAALAARAERTRADADKVIAELAKLAFANMLDFVDVDPDGTPRIDFTRLRREDGAAIQSITVDYWRPPIVRKRDRKPDGAPPARAPHVPTPRRVRLALADKRAALVELARHLGMRAPDADHERVPAIIQVVTGVPRAGDPEVIEMRRLEAARGGE